VIATPVFRRIYTVRIVEEDGVYLLSEREPVLLTGKIFIRLAPLLDGRHTVDAINAALHGVVDPVSIRLGLAFLQRKGYIVEASEAAPPARLAFWDELGVDADAAERRLSETTVTVHGVGDVAVDLFVESLSKHGVRVGDGGAIAVVLADDYLQPELATINSASMASGQPWLLVRPLGATIWIGPLFRPRESACWECLAHRLRMNRGVDRYIERRAGETSPIRTPHAVMPGTLQVASGVAALEAVRAITGGGGAPLTNRIATMDLLSHRTDTHVVVRRPQCAVCGSGASAAPPPPISLESRPKAFTADGGHRVHGPEVTLQRYGHHVSVVSGAVKHLERVAIPGAPLLHLYNSGENRAAPARDLAALRRSFRSHSAGKGVTDVQARASALCEALERYSGQLQGDEPRHRATFRELGDRAIHPNACMLFSDEQYRRRDEWNARGQRGYHVPEPFDETAALNWTPLWSLTHGRTRYLPLAYCYYGAGEEIGNRWMVANSNGAAAGNNLEEAVLQGFLELVERDAVGLWWYNRVRRPAVDLDSFDEPYFRAIRAEYASRQRDLWVLDLTTDLGIPCFAALSRRLDHPIDQPIFGFGAHLEPRLGILRAVTEMNQFLTWTTADLGAVDAPEPDDMRDWLLTATVAANPYLLPSDDLPRTAPSYPSLCSDDLREDVRRCQAIVEAKGLEVLVLDQTRADIGLPVARVVVPGLRHFWARYAPGRLYDVPVALGWLPSPLHESAVNPIAMFW
jgi:bacteriocin biosynthesis cyclodehydratase domain-containing protein